MSVERRAQSALQQQELQLDTARAEMESLRESFGMLKELRNDAHQRALDDLSTDVKRALSRVECQQLTAEMRDTSKEASFWKLRCRKPRFRIAKRHFGVLLPHSEFFLNDSSHLAHRSCGVVIVYL